MASTLDTERRDQTPRIQIGLGQRPLGEGDAAAADSGFDHQAGLVEARAALAVVVTWAGLLTATAGCGPEGPLPGAFGPPGRGEVVQVSPRDGSKGVRPGEPLRVRVAEGRLESVKAVVSQDARETPVPFDGDGVRR